MSIAGNVDPAPPYTCQWDLEPTAGLLTNATSPSPTHTEPNAAGEGVLKLTGMNGATVGACEARKRIKVYQDHLDRDRDNFGVGISCEGPWTFTKLGATITMANTWNCFGATDHIYNGSGTGYTPSVGIAAGWVTTIYDAPITAANWAAINGSLTRGDVVSFWSMGSGGFAAQHAHTCKSGVTMYGGNNEPVIRPSGHPATWKWFETTSETYFNNVNSHPRTRDLLARVKVHKKP